ncbi:MAG: DUF4136 domain-containing protein [Spirosoma sp.]|nr:DUF4136 domain-containing protein [Spirosoma sp.]
MTLPDDPIRSTIRWPVDSKLDPGFYFLNDLELKDRIRTSVADELEGRGYKMDRQSPDLMVNFRVFDKPTKIETNSDYGNSYYGAGEIGTIDGMKTIDVAAGAIVLNIVDKKSGQVVWRGLASGLTNANGFDRDKNKIKEAVNLMFNKYEYRADKY